MDKIIKIFIFVVVGVVLGVVYYFYVDTNGFKKEYSEFEIILNEKQIEKTSNNNVLVIGNSYEFKINNKLSNTNEYEVEIKALNDFKFKSGVNYYSWLNICENEEFKNLNEYFFIQEKENSFIIKPIMNVKKIVLSLFNDVEFIDYDEEKDYMSLILTINDYVCTYDFHIIFP